MWMCVAIATGSKRLRLPPSPPVCTCLSFTLGVWEPVDFKLILMTICGVHYTLQVASFRVAIFAESKDVTIPLRAPFVGWSKRYLANRLAVLCI